MAKVRDLARDLFNLGKGIGLNKPRVGHEKEFNLDRFKGALQEKNSLQRANRYVVSIIFEMFYFKKRNLLRSHNDNFRIRVHNY